LEKIILNTNSENLFPIIGYDILPMASSINEEELRVSAVLEFESGKTTEWSNINRRKLLALIRKYKVKSIGTDNPAEILLTGETLSSFLKHLPVVSSLIHVNLTKEGISVSMSKLIQHHNITPSKEKLSPLKTARAIVKLIKLNIGMVLEGFENETIIKIGFPNKSKKGGFSQARYQRQNEEVVFRSYKFLKESLEQNKLNFDYNIVTTKYGAKFAKFHIFSSIMEVKNNVKISSLFPAKIKMWSPQKKIVTHRPLTDSPQIEKVSYYNHLNRLIIGIDPGMVTAVAMINLSGKLINVTSRRNYSKGEIIETIREFGVPVLICSDVRPIPTLVKKLASSYHTHVFSPNSLLSKTEKRSMVSKFLEFTSLNNHEIDALSACIHAFNNYQDDFLKIDTMNYLGTEKDMIKSLLIQGFNLHDSMENIENMRISNLDVEHTKEIKESKSEDILVLLNRFQHLSAEISSNESLINNLRAQIGRLESKLISLESINSSLEKKYSDLVNEKTLNLLGSELIYQKEIQISHLNRVIIEKIDSEESLKQRISDLEKLIWLSIDNDQRAIRILKNFSQDGIYQLNKQREISPADIILILNPTGGGPLTSQYLADSRVRLVFIEGHNLSDEADYVLEKNNIPVLRSEKYNIVKLAEFAVISNKELTKALDDYEKLQMQKFSREKSSLINSTIKEYYYEREKEIIANKKSYDNYEPEDEESGI